MPILIAVVVVGAMLALGALLMWQGWSVARATLLQSAQDSTQAMGRLVDEKVRRLMAPASATLNYLVSDPVMFAFDPGERLERAGTFVQILESIPFLSAAYVGYENGEFILVRPLRSDAVRASLDAPPDAAFLVQSVEHDVRGRKRTVWHFLNAERTRLLARTISDTGFDPRTRPWYIDADQSPGESLTAPYIFFTTQNIGVTLSLASRDGQAVAGLDIDLTDLGDELKTLRLTPNSEIAIVGADGNAYAYTDLARAYRRVGDGVRLSKLAELGVPALTALGAANPAANRPVSLDVDGSSWFGIAMPLAAFPVGQLKLLMATPDSDLLAGIRAGLIRQAWLTAGLAALLLVLGWLIGHRLGRDLSVLARQAQRLTRFDFRQPTVRGSMIREIRQLGEVLGEVCTTIQNFLATTETIGKEPGLDNMLEKVLQQTVASTACSRGAVYLLDSRDGGLELAAVAAPAARAAPGAPLPARLGIGAIAGEGGDLVPLAATQGQLLQPLTDRQGAPLGLLLLEHPRDASHGGAEFRAFAERLSGALSSAIETRRLIEAQRKLLDGFVHLVADAVDAKSPYTGGHCRRVPELATMIVDRMTQEEDGPFKAFRLSEEERHAFHLGAWLHDCGKVTSPEHVIDKATKLEAIHNRIHEVRTRFEVLWRDAEIAHLHRLSAGADPARSAAELASAQAALRDDFAFVATCNIGGEFMTHDAVARIRSIAGRTWLRHFDDRLGLSREEERRLGAASPASLPALEPLLCDRDGDIIPWPGRHPPVRKGDPANVYGFDMSLPPHRENRGEVHNLSIRRGTLTEEERFLVNDHVVQTYAMLKSLPWPRHLERVPEIASTHHERMDGTGYPRRLEGGKLSVEERVMALSDVFEALTAADRPYKPAKRLSEALRIMAFMCKDGHLDPVVFGYFLTSGIWRLYAERFLRPDQRDEVDADALAAIAGAGAPANGAP
ncbi:HD domain-containing phosphohydrolase [Xanthobacter pseudotagetidis]|uniref:HD domain-containing phosphohydrolase n=1 Tax=Xanthobacter pseudotagetidis TaxID=3119911 RepID=UPI00372CDB8B